MTSGDNFLCLSGVLDGFIYPMNYSDEIGALADSLCGISKMAPPLVISSNSLGAAIGAFLLSYLTLVVLFALGL